MATLHKWRKCRLRMPPPDEAKHELVPQPQNESQPQEEAWTVGNGSTSSAEPHVHVFSEVAAEQALPTARTKEMLAIVLTALQQPVGDSKLPLWVILVGLLACWLWVTRSGLRGLNPTWHRELHDEARRARSRQRDRDSAANDMANLHYDLHMRPFQQTSTGRSAAEMSLEQRAAQKAAQIAAQERSRASSSAAARRREDAETKVEDVERHHERGRAHRRRAWRRAQGGVQPAVNATSCSVAGPAAGETSWIDAYEQELARMNTL